jgi:hypothetical protein
MEISSVQNDEIYQAVFAEDVEKALDNIENDPDFYVDSWFSNTMTKVILVYSKYVKGDEAQWQQTIIHVHKLYSREYAINAIKGGFEDQLVQNRAAPEGFTLEGRGVKIITEYPGLLLKSIKTSTIYHPVDKA